VRRVPHVYTVERDPDDSPYVNLAIAAGARYLVTRAKDLLGLMSGRSRQSRDFRSRFRQLRIVDVATFPKEPDALAKS